MRGLALLLAAYWLGCGGSSQPLADAPPAPVDAAPDAPKDLACGELVDGGGSLAMTTPVLKLVADPERCRVYGVAGATVIVLDGKTHEVTSISLSSDATDLDLSADGTTLVVGHSPDHQVTRIDPDTLAIVRMIRTFTDPYAIEVSTRGEAFYVQQDQISAIHRVDLTSGHDTALVGFSGYQGDLELTSDDRILYIGEQGMPGHVTALGVFDGAFGIVDSNGYSHEDPVSMQADTSQRGVTLSADGHLHYAHLLVDTSDLQVVKGKFGERILFEDAASHIAIGVGHTWNADTRAMRTTLTAPISSATVLGGTAWMFEPSTMQLRFAPTSGL
ncbi:MAG: hypothetical protein K8W52_34190 [Deltaproteobacteria bacterium]|nr:hypothetical protein [Deltaproteobacteria bacterium]